MNTPNDQTPNKPTDQASATDKGTSSFTRPGQPAATKPADGQYGAGKGQTETGKPQQSAMPAGDASKTNWTQQVGAARATWSKLTEDELINSNGQEQKLSSLIQDRYTVSRDEADRQVKGFLSKQAA